MIMAALFGCGNDEDMDNENSTEDDLLPRPYQSVVLDLALKQNTIVFLPTGSGKTFIAVMLIKHMAADIQEKFSSGGKRTFFLVNTVALAEQQKNYIQRHTCLSVGHYTGDMNVDFWKEAKWRDELDEHQVLVMTAQILLDILNHKYLKLSDINVIVFDECHHAVNQHCMNKIMRNFAYCPLSEQPRVLGLTATLLNSSVKYHRVIDTVTLLEETFKSKVATIPSVDEVESFSTNPNEIHVTFGRPENHEIMTEIKYHIDRLCTFLESYEFDEDKSAAPILDGAILQRSKPFRKKLINKLCDVWIHVEMLGLYGGSLSALKLIMLFERLRAKAEPNDSVLIYTSIVTTLNMIRKLIDDKMGNVSERMKIFMYSSPQVLTLLEVLKDYQPDEGRGLIFVERRLTAKVLFQILRTASETIADLRYVRADFVVGFSNNPMSFTREGQLEKKWNTKAIQRFQKGETNIVVASVVLEEGIDIPLCKLVVKFDAPTSYRSYIQSKGRARHKNSHFVVLIPKEEEQKLCQELREYECIEKLLKGVLSGTRHTSSGPDVVDKDLEEKPYWTNTGAKVTYTTAIPLINRYCSKLPQDCFTKLMPYWFLMDDAKSLYQCILQLPINSPLKEAFKGEKSTNKKRAKQSAAFAACKVLHETGELNDKLLPVGHQAKIFIEEDKIFSVFQEAAADDEMEQPGTKKCRRLYPKQIPECLTGCSPAENVCLYLHVLSMSPSYKELVDDSTRKYAFYKLLQSDNCFAILSSKRLPEVCDFPVYLNVGRISVSVLINSSTVKLTSNQILKLRQFHTMLFFDLLKLHKKYIVTSLKSEGNDYLIVPVKKNVLLNSYEIDWQVIQNNCQLTVFKQPSDTERLGSDDCNFSNFEHTLVVPWYRGLPPDQVYVVTQVCQHMSPLSCFPTPQYSTFEEYFNRKYTLEIYNSSQPLFEVKAITNHLNCLKPRTGHVSGRSKRQEQNEDFEEHLVPELCITIDFPSTLWVKAVCLPSCLHRISHLLLAEELRQEIQRDLLFPSQADEKLKCLQIDPDCIAENTDQQKHSVGYSNVKNNFTSLLNPKISNWGGDGEPVDIDRERVEDVTLMDIIYYDEFINKPSISSDDGSSTIESDENADVEIPEVGEFSVQEISFLKEDGHGLELSKILQALTCSCSNDAFNLERLETLGDSFLKFASSLFLFIRYPKLDEGKLTQAKGKIVGNRNLFYCGRKRNIIGKMKVHEFNPKSDWIPPMFSVPSEIIQSLLENELCPSVLFEIEFSREEQEKGILEFSSQCRWQDVLNTSDRQYTSSPTESLMGVQSVPDKMVADCVEALIGTYLQGYGIKGALKLLGWLGILPTDMANPSYLLDNSSCSPYINDAHDCITKVNHLLKDYEVEELEKNMDYVFNDRGYLLQALSHASFSQNRVTDCYQRLEFLGDAILDFLITCHIYEHGGGLSPGELTDLRSALVNNITFGSLAVRYGLQKFCHYDSPKLFEKIDTFVSFQEKHGHKINEDVLLLLDENAAIIGESVDVPKVLGDLFESLAGAIYLDSGKNLQTVWRVYYRLMRKEIESFRQDIPKQPVRILYEQCNPPPVFSGSRLLEEGKKVIVELEVISKGIKHQFYGVGENKAEAKRTAAKIALKKLF